MNVLLKKETVYDLDFKSSDLVYFVTDEYDSRILSLSRQDWEDFGEPEQITATVQAGDLLNDK